MAALTSFKRYMQDHGHVVYRFAEVDAQQGLLVRSGIEADSARVARLPHGAPVRVVREATSSAGLVRLRIQTRGGAFSAGPVDGWASETSARGTRLLSITDAHPPADGEPGEGDGGDGASAFADFVLARVATPEALCAGSGALDVGGGTGFFARDLATRGVRCNLVDPSAPEVLRERDRADIKRAGGPLYRIYKRHFDAGDPEPDDGAAAREAAARGDEAAELRAESQPIQDTSNSNVPERRFGGTLSDRRELGD